MHSFQNFIVRLIPNHPPPLETRIWKLVVRALVTLGNFVQLAMLFLATLLSTWVDVVLKLHSFECGSHSTLTAVTIMHA